MFSKLFSKLKLFNKKQEKSSVKTESELEEVDKSIQKDSEMNHTTEQNSHSNKKETNK